MQFFIPMRPPTVTHHDKELHAFMRGGRPCAVLHDSAELKEARSKLRAGLAPHAPAIPLGGPVRLVVKWLFPAQGRHPDGAFQARHRQPGQGPERRDDPPALLARRRPGGQRDFGKVLGQYPGDFHSGGGAGMNGLEWIVRIAAGLGGGVLVLFLLAGSLGAIAACMLSARITHDQEQAELEKNLRR